MAKNKNPKNEPTPEPILDSALRNEMEALEKLERKAVIFDGDNAELLDLSSSVTTLTLTRGLLRDLDEARKAKASEIMPEAVSLKLKQLDAEARTLKARGERIESTLVGALEREITEGRLTEGVTSREDCKLILAQRPVLIVEDVALLPDEYILREPNKPKIEAALKEWQAKVEAAKLLDLTPPPCPVPGAHMGKRIVLTTKAPELIEE